MIGNLLEKNMKHINTSVLQIEINLNKGGVILGQFMI